MFELFMYIWVDTGRETNRRREKERDIQTDRPTEIQRETMT